MTDLNTEILIHFGQTLRTFRKERNLTLLELEVRSGINEGDISKIENGKKKLAFTTFIKLSRGLDLTPSQFLKEFKIQ